MNANIGIPDPHLREVATKLNKVLANETVLYIKTRNYHWNVEGHTFGELHKFYEAQFEELDEIIDNTAERIRALGHYAEGRLKDLLKLTDLEEQDYTSDPKNQLQNLLNDHETIIRLLRNLIPDFGEVNKDLGTADFITGLLRAHEKMAWMIRSYLK
jgi:starvation-inducible DNA-binding protein